jgi:hypothetical protein
MAERKKIDFSLFTDTQVLDLARQVDREIARRRRAARALVRERGGLFEGEPPRYRNPNNPSQTWSGRGAEPRWVLEALSLGLSLSDLERDDNRPVSRDD